MKTIRSDINDFFYEIEKEKYINVFFSKERKFEVWTVKNKATCFHFDYELQEMRITNDRISLKANQIEKIINEMKYLYPELLI